MSRKPPALFGRNVARILAPVLAACFAIFKADSISAGSSESKRISKIAGSKRRTDARAAAICDALAPASEMQIFEAGSTSFDYMLGWLQ